MLGAGTITASFDKLVWHLICILQIETIKIQMHFLIQLLNPGIINLLALLLSVVWMLRDDKDRTRPVLVFALVLNLLYSWAFYVVLVQENALVPWKFDHVLANLDDALGLTTAMIAVPLQGAWRLPLEIAYQMIIPMMIVWYFANRANAGRGSVVLAYGAELFAGLPLYTLLPACGPIYAFRADWLHPPDVQAETVRFSGMPNAFPSLHLATAVVFVFYAHGRFWRAISLAMLAATALATLSTGEHYVIDLVAGIAFGCFAASVGYRRARSAVFYFVVVVGWSLGIRFGHQALMVHPWLLRSLSALTVAIGLSAIGGEWLTKRAIFAALPFSESRRDGELGTSPLSS
jgi:hypothetical protein